MTKHFVRFYFQGVIISETEDREVTNRDIRDITVPQHAYGYRFFDKEEVVINGEVLRGSIKNSSEKFIIGTLMTIEEVRKTYPTIANEMDYNHITKVVKCPYRWYIPSEDEEFTLIDPRTISFESE